MALSPTLLGLLLPPGLAGPPSLGLRGWRGADVQHHIWPLFTWVPCTGLQPLSRHGERAYLLSHLASPVSLGSTQPCEFCSNRRPTEPAGFPLVFMAWTVEQAGPSDCGLPNSRLVIFPLLITFFVPQGLWGVRLHQARADRSHTQLLGQPG